MTETSLKDAEKKSLKTHFIKSGVQRVTNTPTFRLGMK